MFKALLAFFVTFFISIGAQAQERAQLLRIGDECFSRQSTEEALRYYDQAYALSPKNNETLLRLVRTYCDLGWIHLRTDTSAQS